MISALSIGGPDTLELYQLRIFLTISAGFIALYAFGILVAWWTKSEARRTMFQAKTAAAALLFAFALTAVASGFLAVPRAEYRQ